MRDEASSILYKQEIIFEDTTALHAFVTFIGPYNRRLLSDLTIKGWGDGHSAQHFAAFAAMADCVNLRSLFVDCTIGWYHYSPEKVARQIYKHAYFFLQEYGIANGSYDAGVDVLEMSEFHFKEQNADKDMVFSAKKYEVFNEVLRSYLRRK